MTSQSDRRADCTRRIPVEALVEVCGVSGKQAPFEAESADVSGRGIRLRTAYLPDPGASVVCRFENGGQEVIAEGIVAWCHKESRGGEFGVRFTALDARSAEILRELCGTGEDASGKPPEAVAKPEALAPQVIKGAKVKLHIEGLGSPMRARVDAGSGNRIEVGSTLEFLKIGRKLEMESLEDGTRREARIDGINVAVDPSTGVPRLLVHLRTDGDEITPQPSVVDAQRTKSHAPKITPVRPASAASSQAEEVASAPSLENATQEEIDEQVEIMVGRMRRIAGSARRKMFEMSTQVGSRLGPTMERAFQGMRRFGQRSTVPPAPARRRTAPPPAPSPAERKLRPQNSASRTSQPEVTVSSSQQKLKLKRAAYAITALGLLATVIVVASQPASKVSDAKESVAQNQPAIQGKDQPATGSAQAQNGATQTDAKTGSLTVPVPLFGQTPMATFEPLPLPSAATDDSANAVAAREQALAKATQAAVAPGADPQSLASEDPSEAPQEPVTKPEDVAPWGKGRMRDPILYRIKLDEPGDAIKGLSQSKGFTVTIPGRKAMESPKGFVSRDSRFAKISAQNSSDGVKITWLFKEEAPAYRVRLRKDNVEVLVSEAEASKTDKPSKPQKRD